MSKSPPIIANRKLGREKAWGLCWKDGTIELDPRMSERKRLEITIHEVLHHQFPEMPENDVLRHSKGLYRVLWKQGYRRTG